MGTKYINRILLTLTSVVVKVALFFIPFFLSRDILLKMTNEWIMIIIVVFWFILSHFLDDLNSIGEKW